MTVLIAVATRHGATREIADELGATLRQALASLGEDSRVDVLFAENVYDVSGYEVCVLGSAVYNGRWLDAARRLVERHHEQLSTKPVWLFSSGPAWPAFAGPRGGDPDSSGAADVAQLARLSGAYQHRVFGGKIDRSRLPFTERAVAGALGYRDGDFRDWEGIRSWARAIASAQHASREPSLTGGPR
ncbi:MAG TPA: flavodoxin domain-containing protein [Amycolatopsis sp.]|nr:flavodoxin domain-containing protein [Amycolatopsis sp.]